ncbi:MAG: hypothetical protein KAQ98_13720, partial [Bacteriovoracaceae bacterium]|nr:hypothetical protein [Bacteriovoracaceae bacterium]
GHEVGNGGGAIVCRENAKITRSVSYDLWSGENDGVLIEDRVHYLDINRNNRESAKRQAHKAIERFAQFNSELAKPFKMVLDTVIKKIDSELSGARSKRLPTKNDFNPRSLPEEVFCPGAKILPEYETAAIYYDSLNVESGTHVDVSQDSSLRYLRRINYELYKEIIDSYNRPAKNLYYLEKKLLQKDTIDIYTKVIKNFETNTDLAALYVHEAIYKIVRFTGLANNSDLVADVVALLFSESENELLYSKFNEVFKTIIDRGAVNVSVSYASSRSFIYPYSPDHFMKNISGRLLESSDIEEIKLAYNDSSVSEGVEYEIVKDHVIKERNFRYMTGIFGDRSTVLTETILSMAIRELNAKLVEFLLEKDGFSASNTINGFKFSPKTYNMLQVAEGIDTGNSLEKIKKNRIIEMLKENIQ